MTSVSRRDWQLQQLGITQWVLHRPAVLLGEIAVTLPHDVKLIIVAESPLSLNDGLVSDILRTLRLQPSQVFQLTPDKVAMLPSKIPCNSWSLGVDAPDMLTGSKLTSPRFSELSSNSHARQQLWQQMCEYEYDFFPEL